MSSAPWPSKADALCRAQALCIVSSSLFTTVKSDRDVYCKVDAASLTSVSSTASPSLAKLLAEQREVRCQRNHANSM